MLNPPYLLYIIIFHLRTSEIRPIFPYFRLPTSDSRLHIKCTPERNAAVAVRSIAGAPAVRVTTAIVVIASSKSTRGSITATSVSTVLCSPLSCI